MQSGCHTFLKMLSDEMLHHLGSAPSTSRESEIRPKYDIEKFASCWHLRSEPITYLAQFFSKGFQAA